MSEMKVVYMDGEQPKAVQGTIVSEDLHFIILRAIGSGIEFRLNKNYVVSMKEVKA